MPSVAERTTAAGLRAQLVGEGSLRPTPVIAAAKLIGFTVEEFTPDKQTEVVAGMVDHASKTILVNKNDSPERKRFTIAHEIGHVVLHGDEQEDWVDFRHTTDYTLEQEPKERQANEFAADLLMPRKLFEAMWRGYRGNVNDIAEMLQVSRQAVIARSKHLKIA